jgi:thymidylate kinase
MMLRLRGSPLARPRWLGGIQGQLDYFDGRCNRDELAVVLAKQLPTLDLPLVDRCLQALRGEINPLEAAWVRLTLYRRLKAHLRRPSIEALTAATGEKLLPGFIRLMLFDGRMRPATGGLVFALSGGDGAGKSTCAHQLRHWLSGHLPTLHAHLGRPPRSLLTFLVGGALKLESWLYHRIKRQRPAGSFIELLRHLCTARDRYLLYQKVRRFAASGGVAICERYPIHEDRVLVGPCIPGAMAANPGRWARMLASQEESYYQAMLPPDLVCVLRLDPELAVKRKPEEPADYVRARARVVWETKWSRPNIRVIDASRPLADVVIDLKNVLWSAL